jgi:hypothetical protein
LNVPKIKKRILFLKKVKYSKKYQIKILIALNLKIVKALILMKIFYLEIKIK